MLSLLVWYALASMAFVSDISLIRQLLQGFLFKSFLSHAQWTTPLRCMSGPG